MIVRNDTLAPVTVWMVNQDIKVTIELLPGGEYQWPDQDADIARWADLFRSARVEVRFRQASIGIAFRPRDFGIGQVVSVIDA